MKIATLTLFPALLASGAVWATGIPVVDPTTVNWPLAALIAVLFLTGVRFTFRAIVHRHDEQYVSEKWSMLAQKIKELPGSNAA